MNLFYHLNYNSCTAKLIVSWSSHTNHDSTLLESVTKLQSKPKVIFMTVKLIVGTFVTSHDTCSYLPEIYYYFCHLFKFVVCNF